MSIYWMRTALEAVASSRDWSETTKRRKPIKGSNRWCPTYADRAPLGPLPQDIRNEIDAHWALSFAKNDALPDTFMTLDCGHFSAAPFARRKVGDVFAHYAEGNSELIPIRRFWSLHDDAEVPETYYVANVYNAADVVDLDLVTSSRRVVNPMHGQPFTLFTSNPKAVFVRAKSFRGHHLLRDRMTSDWFCSDVFRAAINAATPGTYDFREVNIV